IVFRSRSQSALSRRPSFCMIRTSRLKHSGTVISGGYSDIDSGQPQSESKATAPNIVAICSPFLLRGFQRWFGYRHRPSGTKGELAWVTETGDGVVMLFPLPQLTHYKGGPCRILSPRTIQRTATFH